MRYHPPFCHPPTAPLSLCIHAFTSLYMRLLTSYLYNLSRIPCVLQVAVKMLSGDARCVSDVLVVRIYFNTIEFRDICNHIYAVLPYRRTSHARQPCYATCVILTYWPCSVWSKGISYSCMYCHLVLVSFHNTSLEKNSPSAWEHGKNSSTKMHFFTSAIVISSLWILLCPQRGWLDGIHCLCASCQRLTAASASRGRTQSDCSSSDRHWHSSFSNSLHGCALICIFIFIFIYIYIYIYIHIYTYIYIYIHIYIYIYIYLTLFLGVPLFSYSLPGYALVL